MQSLPNNRLALLWIWRPSGKLWIRHRKRLHGSKISRLVEEREGRHQNCSLQKFPTSHWNSMNILKQGLIGGTGVGGVSRNSIQNVKWMTAIKNCQLQTIRTRTNVFYRSLIFSRWVLTQVYWIERKKLLLCWAFFLVDSVLCLVQIFCINNCLSINWHRLP